MIDPNKITFIESQPDGRTLALEVVGSINLRQSVTFDAYCHRDEMDRARDEVKHLIRVAIWQQAYGELLEPLLELRDMALRHVGPDALPEFQRHFNELFKLLEGPRRDS